MTGIQFITDEGPQIAVFRVGHRASGGTQTDKPLLLTPAAPQEVRY
jgi:hypothetical protein